MAAHEGLIRSFLDATSDASEFFQPSAELLKTTRELLKVVYCVSQIAKSEISGIPQANGSNQQLHVDGFDPEQIWAMLEQQTPADLNKMRCATFVLPGDYWLGCQLPAPSALLRCATAQGAHPARWHASRSWGAH